MKSTCLLLMASVVLCYLVVCGGQGLPADDDTDRRTIDDMLLEKAESLLIRSILKKIQEEDDGTGGFSSQTDWVTKRQHPGKRFSYELEKRQHPGRREEDEDEDTEEEWDVQKRQHPGKRQDETHSVLEVQRRQHPGKRSTLGYSSDEPVLLVHSELSKRQHPGKRYVLLHTKRQHPGKRSGEGEDGGGGGGGEWDAGADGDDELAGLEKRQHPGKRFWDNSDLGANSPCDVLDPSSCSKTSLLLDFLDNINKSHAEEKRQHPGKRFEPERDLETEE